MRNGLCNHRTQSTPCSNQGPGIYQSACWIVFSGKIPDRSPVIYKSQEILCVSHFCLFSFRRINLWMFDNWNFNSFFCSLQTYQGVPLRTNKYQSFCYWSLVLLCSRVHVWASPNSIVTNIRFCWSWSEDACFLEKRCVFARTQYEVETEWIWSWTLWEGTKKDRIRGLIVEDS